MAAQQAVKHIVSTSTCLIEATAQCMNLGLGDGVRVTGQAVRSVLEVEGATHSQEKSQSAACGGAAFAISGGLSMAERPSREGGFYLWR